MIDLYCERTGPGLWAEPLNASTNLAYFLAAWAVWNLAKRSWMMTGGIQVLFGLMVSIGIGSSLFHTFATPWAQILDVVPILLFQIVYLWVYGRGILNLSYGVAGGLLAGFFASAHYARQFPHILNGSLMYAPAFLLILGLGLCHYFQNMRGRSNLLAAAAVFLVAVFFRTIDNAICPSFRFGTHFLWHLLTAAVLYLSMRGVLLNVSRVSRYA